MLLACGRVLLDADRPVLAHLVATRRCNLSCTYCNEYDRTSAPVETDRLVERVDYLADLGTAAVGISGGEPLLHPELAAVIRHARARGMVAGVITNGYFLNPARIAGLNAAGLDFMQISIDNVEPDEVSMKSLRVLARKLRWLQEHALFDVNINSVIDAGTKHPDDVLQIFSAARRLGFSTSLGIIHDTVGGLRPLGAAERQIYDDFKRSGRGGLNFFRNFYARIDAFQENLAVGRPNKWHCGAGARYLYVDEFGVVSYCSQQRGRPGIALSEYSTADIRREFAVRKPCAPLCTIGCVHRVSTMDRLRRTSRALAKDAVGR